LDLAKVLDGERYLEGTFTFRHKTVGVYDVGKAAVVQTEATMVDDTGKEYVKIVSSAFHRDAGGFGGERPPKQSVDATPPPRSPDKVTVFKTLRQQAVIYRLSGDYNPLVRCLRRVE
jgi:peroxisomal enoyl-CoA hydratase 2